MFISSHALGTFSWDILGTSLRPIFTGLDNWFDKSNDKESDDKKLEADGKEKFTD